MLDDGTEIWLNSASELRYPAHFVGNERRVYLTGEAYFQVVRNEVAPFIVETRDMDVKVLGTSFNVSAYMKMRRIVMRLLWKVGLRWMIRLTGKR